MLFPITGAAMNEEDFSMHLRDALPELGRIARRLEMVLINAPDLLQETCLRAWNARHQYEADQPIRAWLRAIMRNVVNERVRGIAGAAELKAFSIEASLERYEENLRSGSQQTPGDRSVVTATTIEASQENHIALFQAIDRINHLSPKQQAAMQTVVLQEMDYPEASEKLGVTIAQLKNSLSDARQAMREDRKVIGRPNRRSK